MELFGDVTGRNSGAPSDIDHLRIPSSALAIPPADTRQPLPADQVQRLLWSRLCSFSVFILAYFIIGLVLSLVEPGSKFHQEHAAFVLLPWSVAILGIIAGLLFSAWPRNLARLQILEVTLFGVVCLQFALAMYHAFQRNTPGNPVPSDMTIYMAIGANHVLRWFALIAAYGTFIPNRGRFTVVVVLGMAATPLLVLFVTSLHDALLRHLIVTDVLWHSLFWLTCAVALSLFGSRKLRILRQAVLEASQLGQYRIERLLGQGGAGAVYLARHQRLHRPCAIKVIRPEKAGDRAAQQRFENEVQAMADLNHPNCVEIFDYGRAEDGSLYYAMEYLTGMTLADMVQKHGPLPPERGIALLRQTCAALRAAHTRGLVHRDVKPSNIFVTFQEGIGDLAKLLDFGLVQVDALYGADAVHVTLEGNTVGTPWFMSPEQIVAGGKLDGRSDLYSLGATAYFLLTGQPPFDQPNAVEVFSAHLHEAPTPLTRINDDLPTDLQGVILHCLEKNRDDRFEDATALDAALAACRDAGRWNAERATIWWRSLTSN